MVVEWDRSVPSSTCQYKTYRKEIVCQSQVANTEDTGSLKVGECVLVFPLDSTLSKKTGRAKTTLLSHNRLSNGRTVLYTWWIRPLYNGSDCLEEKNSPESGWCYHSISIT